MTQNHSQESKENFSPRILSKTSELQANTGHEMQMVLIQESISSCLTLSIVRVETRHLPMGGHFAISTASDYRLPADQSQVPFVAQRTSDPQCLGESGVVMTVQLFEAVCDIPV